MHGRISKAGAERIRQKISMSKEEFMDEHRDLVKVLRHGSRLQRSREAMKQNKEMGKY